MSLGRGPISDGRLPALPFSRIAALLLAITLTAVMADIASYEIVPMVARSAVIITPKAP